VNGLQFCRVDSVSGMEDKDDARVKVWSVYTEAGLLLIGLGTVIVVIHVITIY